MSPSAADPPAEGRVPRLRLRVSRVAESIIRSGHPWVFTDSVRESNRAGETGELAVIYDRNDRFLAVGLFDSASPIQVRILHQGKPCIIDDAWFEHNLHKALEVRERLFGPVVCVGASEGEAQSEPGPSPNPLPEGEGDTPPPSFDTRAPRLLEPLGSDVFSPGGEGQGEGAPLETTGYRLMNGESDGWPALVLDRYGRTYVLKLYSTAWLQRLELLQSLLVKALAPLRIVLRLSRNIQDPAAKAFGRRDGEVLFGPPLDMASDTGTPRGSGDSLSPPTGWGQPAPSPRFRENGIWFEADVVHGQKTGFFLDQRENRRRIGVLAGNRRVLNAFSFTGGFSLYAARGGARTVTDLDISSHALDGANRNFGLNDDDLKISRCAHECIQADAFEWLNRKPDREFDLVVLDPPSLARREMERAGAIAAYNRLAATAIPWLARGGTLFAASCSAHVSAEEFLDAVRNAARSSGRRFSEMETTGHAPDHPATFPEARYLKGIYLRF